MAESDQLALQQWSVGRASRSQRRIVVRRLLQGDEAARAATAVAVAAPSAGVSGPVIDGVFGRALARAAAAGPTREQEKEAAKVFCESLLDLSHEERCRRLESLEPRARTTALVDALRREGYARRLGQPAEALSWSELAVCCAETLPASVSSRLASDAGSEAWAYHGNALRVAARLPEAEEAFRRARRLAVDGTGDSRLRAERLRLEAALALDRSRFDAADRLYQRSLSVSLSTGDEIGAARVRLARGALLVAAGRQLEALALLEEAGAALARLGDARRALVARHNHLSVLVSLGRFEEALPLFAELGRAYDPQRDRRDLVRLRWLEGRAWLGLGRDAEGELRLREVRDALLADGLSLDAAFLTLDLAASLAKQGRWQELMESAAASARVFDSQGTYPEAGKALGLLCVAAQRGRVDQRLLSRLNKSLERLQ